VKMFVVVVGIMKRKKRDGCSSVTIAVVAVVDVIVVVVYSTE